VPSGRRKFNADALARGAYGDRFCLASPTCGRVEAVPPRRSSWQRRKKNSPASTQDSGLFLFQRARINDSLTKRQLLRLDHEREDFHGIAGFELVLVRQLCRSVCRKLEMRQAETSVNVEARLGSHIGKDFAG